MSNLELIAVMLIMIMVMMLLLLEPEFFHAQEWTSWCFPSTTTPVPLTKPRPFLSTPGPRYGHQNFFKSVKWFDPLLPDDRLMIPLPFPFSPTVIFVFPPDNQETPVPFIDNISPMFPSTLVIPNVPLTTPRPSAPLVLLSIRWCLPNFWFCKSVK